MKSKKKNAGNAWKLSEILGGILVVSLVGYTIYVGVAQWLEDKFLDSNAEVVTAIIINEKNYTGNSPVSQTFTYSYMFYVNGKTYKDDSQKPNLNVGDSVRVEYLPAFPIFNRLAEN